MSGIIFHIGEQVVCVEADFWRNPKWRRMVQTVPERNTVYTVRSFREDNGLLGLHLDEIVNPLVLFSGEWGEPAFLHTRFRPVRKSSIAVFEKILDSARGNAGRKELECV
jgi:hypothetical protein